VRVAVAACGINYPDVLMISDLYQARPERPFAPGGEVAGVIDAIGPGVSGLAIGDRVAAGIGVGGLAEAVVTDAYRCFPIPATMSWETAAALLLTYGTSYYALRGRGDLQPGETLFVLGAAGGVGLAATELGKALGARVIAGVSSAAKAEAVRSRGADDVLIYPTCPLDKDAGRSFSRQLKDMAGGGVDVAYDAVGGGYAEPTLRAMAWEGRYLIIGFPAGIARIPLNLPLLKGCSVIGVFWGESVERNPAGYRKDVADLFALHEQGKIDPLISEVFPLNRGGEAIARLAARAAIGKLVVTVRP
jgi:NADPH2:quinone reductase